MCLQVYSFEMAGEGEEEEGEEEADLTKTPIMKEQWITIHIFNLSLHYITPFLRMRDFFFIPDPTSAIKDEGEKFVFIFFVATN